MLKIGERHTVVKNEETPLWSTEVYTEENELGECVVFQQSFPDRFLGFKTEQVMIKENDIPKLIEFLQSVIDPTKK